MDFAQQAFDRLRQIYLKQYDRNDPCVPELVETLTERDWFEQRCVVRICKLEAQLAEAEDANNDDLIDRIEKRLLNEDGLHEVTRRGRLSACREL